MLLLKNKISFWIIIPLLIGTLFFSACDTPPVYEKNITLKNKQWWADTISTFNFTIEDTSSAYNIYYNIRNTSSYPFYNLYITYHLKDSSGHTLKKLLHENLLFDDKTGKPMGSGLGDIFSHQFLLLENYSFKNQGKYTVTLQQYMRKDPLPEVVSTGVRVEKAD